MAVAVRASQIGIPQLVLGPRVPPNSDVPSRWRMAALVHRLVRRLAVDTDETRTPRHPFVLAYSI